MNQTAHVNVVLWRKNLMTKRMAAANTIQTTAPATVTIRMIPQPGNVQYVVVNIVLKMVVVVHGVVVTTASTNITSIC